MGLNSQTKLSKRFTSFLLEVLSVLNSNLIYLNIFTMGLTNQFVTKIIITGIHFNNKMDDQKLKVIPFIFNLKLSTETRLSFEDKFVFGSIRSFQSAETGREH